MSDDKKPKGKPRNVKNVIPIGDKEVSVYASPKVSKALEEKFASWSFLAVQFHPPFKLKMVHQLGPADEHGRFIVRVADGTPAVQHLNTAYQHLVQIQGRATT